MERRKFTREFKLEAVRLIKERGVSYAQASQDLGVHTSQLRDWVKKFADDPQHASIARSDAGRTTPLPPACRAKCAWRRTSDRSKGSWSEPSHRNGVLDRAITQLKLECRIKQAKRSG